METNETILTRKVAGMTDRKLLGKVKGLCVDCDTLAVSHFIVNSASTNASLALPFKEALSVGDTFVTIQSREDFVTVGSAVERSIVNEGFSLVGVEAFSRTGNRLGVVQSYEFDPVFGTVDRVLLDSGEAFAADAFVFFAPEFVFFDDGEKTAPELRAQELEGNNDSELSPSAEGGQAASGASDDAGSADGQEAAEEKPSRAEDDAALIEFLLGSVLSEEVVSADGAFKAEKGVEITEELIAEAREHDALLLLTMSVES